jgi:hypothetical protein
MHPYNGHGVFPAATLRAFDKLRGQGSEDLYNY